MDGPTLFDKILTKRGLNANALAVAIKQKNGQSTFHRFRSGLTKNPSRKTLEKAANHLGVDVLAFFDPMLAEREWERISGEVSDRISARVPGSDLSRGLLAVAEASRALDPVARQNVAELLTLVVRDPDANADDQIPIIMRKLSGESATEAGEHKGTGTHG